MHWLSVLVPSTGLVTCSNQSWEVSELGILPVLPCEGVERFCVRGTVNSDWGFRVEEDLPLL